MLSHWRITPLTAHVMIVQFSDILLGRGFAKTSMFRARRGLLDDSSALIREDWEREGRGR